MLRTVMKLSIVIYSNEAISYLINEAVYRNYGGKEDHCFDWICASSSMPMLSQIVEIDGKKLLDGGVADSIPVRYFEEIGYDKSVVVFTQPEHYQKKKNSLMPLIREK